MWTQEGLLWVVGLVATILTAVLGFSGLFSPPVEQWLKVIAAVLAVITAYIKGSPLPRKEWTEEQRAALAKK